MEQKVERDALLLGRLFRMGRSYANAEEVKSGADEAESVARLVRAALGDVSPERRATVPIALVAPAYCTGLVRQYAERYEARNGRPRPSESVAFEPSGLLHRLIMEDDWCGPAFILAEPEGSTDAAIIWARALLAVDEETAVIICRWDGLPGAADSPGAALALMRPDGIAIDASCSEARYTLLEGDAAMTPTRCSPLETLRGHL